MLEERRQVMVWFGRPIQPEHIASFIRTNRVEDPPLDVDELPGTLIDWQRHPDGWWGLVEYRYPTHGIGMQNYIGWFPASRLRPVVN